MSDPKLSIVVDVETDPAKKALREVDTALDKTAKNAKVTGSRIDEAFKTAGGKVQEAIGPLGKLLSPEALGVGAIGLAAAGLYRFAAAGADAAREVAKLGVASGVLPARIEEMNRAATAFEAAQNRMTGNFARMSSGMVGFVATVMQGFNDLASGSLDSIERGSSAGYAPRSGPGSSDAPRYQSEINKAVTEYVNRVFFSDNRPESDLSGEGITPGRKSFRSTRIRYKPPKTAAELAQAARAESKKRDQAWARVGRYYDARGADWDWQAGLAADRARADDEFQQNLDEADAATARANQADIDRVTRAREIARRNREEAAQRAADQTAARNAQMTSIGASGLGSLASSALRGDASGALSAVSGAASGLASVGLSAVLGPIFGPLAGSLVGGVLDGLIGAVLGEDEGSKARREAMERTRERWRNTQRDRAWQRRQNLPELAAFSGPSAGATIVNVSFNAPVSSRRAARELADVLRAGGP